MPLQDEMTFQRIETLLDMRFKKLHEEIKVLKDEVSVTRDEVRKLTQAMHERPQATPAYAPQWQEPAPQAAGYPPPQQQWAQAPPQGYPPQQPTNRYAGQFDAPASPHQAPPQQAPAAQQRNKWAPPPEKAPETQPIDRNGVAPSDVTIEKFFYMGNRKK